MGRNETSILTDHDAWNKYPQHRWFFNKLWVNEQVGNKCGPAGIFVPHDNYYCVRPIYNLHGMGLGASKQYITTDNQTTVPPGYFWTEWLEGDHVSVDYYRVEHQWFQSHTFQGFRHEGQPFYRFHRWERIDKQFRIPRILERTTWDLKYANVEFIGNKPIEIHLRTNPDPVDYDVFIPVWMSDININMVEYVQQGFEFVDNKEDVGDDQRLGFFCK